MACFIRVIGLIRYWNTVFSPVFTSTVATIPAGSYVLFLGYTYDSNVTWAYIEVVANNSIMRGFVPYTALK